MSVLLFPKEGRIFCPSLISKTFLCRIREGNEESWFLILPALPTMPCPGSVAGGTSVWSVSVYFIGILGGPWRRGFQWLRFHLPSVSPYSALASWLSILAASYQEHLWSSLKDSLATYVGQVKSDWAIPGCHEPWASTTASSNISWDIPGNISAGNFKFSVGTSLLFSQE